MNNIRTVHTLTVIDEDPTSVTRNEVIVSSRAIHIIPNVQLEDLEIGEGIEENKEHTLSLPSVAWQMLNYQIRMNNCKYRLHVCTDKPNQNEVDVNDVIMVWERVE